MAKPTLAVCGLLALLTNLAFLGGARSGASPRNAVQHAAKVYVCPPCGQACDNPTYDKPGVCPICGMTLIVRPAGAPKGPAFKVNGTVAILLFPGVDIIDFSGPWEVFGVAKYNVVTVAQNPGPLHTSYAETVTPDFTFENCPKVDVLLLPGGNVPSFDKSDPVMQWIRKKSGETPYTLSVCNGAYWLAQAGLLDGRPATTMYGMCDSLAKSFPKIHVVTDKRFVDAGRIVTTAGLSAGIDGAFHMVEKMQGSKFARSAALAMEYNWQPNPTYLRATYADKYLMRLGRVHLPPGARRSRIAGFGDANRWEDQWEVTTTSSTAKDVMAALEETLLAAKWRRVSSRSGAVLESTWHFRGDKGETWTARFSLRKGTDSFIVQTLLRKGSQIG